MKSIILCALVAVAPKIFLANAGAPTFTPDGRTMYFTRTSGIFESHRNGDQWSEPKLASFSSEGRNQQPALAPDGSFLVFVSVRDHAANLWRVDRQGTGWSAPTRLPDAVNVGRSIWRPSIARDGSIYFFVIGKDEKGRTMRLYRSQCDHGQYLPAMPLPFSSGATQDVDPEIAPDESFIVFASAGRAAPADSNEHLFMARRRGQEWGPVTRLDVGRGDATANEPRLSPDHKTLYFSDDRDAWSVEFLVD